MEQQRYSEIADQETASADYASRFAGEVGNYFLQVQTDSILQALQHLPTGAKILDVGGGHAQLARPLIDAGYLLTVTGSADRCRERLDKSCIPGSFSYQTCDSLALPFAEQEFDAVISVRLIPHAHHWQKLIEEMCRVSRQTVLFDYPDYRSSNILYTILFKVKKNLEGNTRTYTLFSRRQMKHALTKSGFNVEHFKPEFFFPMVLHRKLQRPTLSKTLEGISMALRLTHCFGSPIIVHAERCS